MFFKLNYLRIYVNTPFQGALRSMFITKNNLNIWTFALNQLLSPSWHLDLMAENVACLLD